MTPVALACLLLPGSQADLTAPITFEHRAAPIGRVLAKLSEVTKIPFEAAPTMAGEVVLISVKGVTATDLMQRIATVTSGEWKLDDGVYRLGANAGMRNREANDEFAAKVTALRKLVAKRAEEQKANAAKKGTVPDGALGFRSQISFATTAQANPSELAFTALLQQIDLRAIADLKSNDRVVFSTNPNRMQRALPNNTGAILSGLVAAHNDEAKKTDMNEALNNANVEIPAFLKETMLRRNRPIGTVAKTLLVVTKPQFGGFGAMTLELRMYDADGKIAYTTTTMLQSGNKAMERVMAAAENKPRPAKETPVELSPESKAIQEAISQGSRTASFELKPEIRAKFFRPDLHDPLSFLATDSLLAVAKKRNRSIVADVPDDMVSLIDSFAGSRLTVEQVEEDLQEAEKAKIVPDEKFLLIKPSHPADARASRLDRVALTALMRATQEKTVPSLDDVAAYALRAPSPMEEGIGQIYVSLFAPGALSQSMSGFTNWEALRFYGLLDPAVRRNLAAGGRIPFSSLSTAQAEQVRRVLFGTLGNLEVEDSTRKDPAQEMPAFMRMFGMGNDSDYRTEPTEAMPNGVPGNGYVTGPAQADFFASPVATDDKPTGGPLAVLGTEELALFQLFQNDANLSSVSAQMPKIDRVRVGQRTVWNLGFHVAPSIAMHTTLNDNRLPQDSPVVAMSNLPAEFRNRIAAKLEQLKKSPLGSLGGMLGRPGVTPPPNY